MKKLFFAFAAAVLLGACESSTKYTITGNAADFEDGAESIWLPLLMMKLSFWTRLS